MNSIARRLTLASNAVLVLSLALIGFSLERTYRESVVTGAGDQLRPVIYALMGSAEEDEGFLSFADGVSQPRLQQPGRVCMPWWRIGPTAFFGARLLLP